ncbi:hypothetical protein pf16_142 [Pseudomonas phage pf16]|uniref:Uncharacterized protein n=1 Tax=Pseudomonas phage pf16 TaxID=1815630 RepID=A0A1S5R413_9CAUD|nr:hypothetical protein FDG98_gp156 [Pseudomonas phage pf16]AND75065.1 hypothetical protein pf16_142 [Pseudomonas phage pf16]
MAKVRITGLKDPSLEQYRRDVTIGKVYEVPDSGGPESLVFLDDANEQNWGIQSVQGIYTFEFVNEEPQPEQDGE